MCVYKYIYLSPSSRFSFLSMSHIHYPPLLLRSVFLGNLRDSFAGKKHHRSHVPRRKVAGMRCHGVELSGGDSALYCPHNTPLSTRRAMAESRLGFFPKTFVYYSNPIPFTSFRLRTRATVSDAIFTEPSELSFYELLGISESGSYVEIKQAYKQLVLKYHPDVSPTDRVEEYTKRFIQVQEAYETLSDPRRRALYDKDMARGLHLAFSARRRHQQDEEMEDKSEWKNRWQGQVSELKRRSMSKDAGENMSWASRMRRQRAEQSNEL